MRRCAAAGLLAALFAAQAAAQGVAEARYADPTGRYGHGALGNAAEWGALVMRTDDGRVLRFVLPASRVFEDTAPRLVDLDGDGAAVVIVVESDVDRGARLVVYGPGGPIAATPFIGRRHRWLAPVGAADLDGDGHVEIAYVDRPHLARVLRVWRFRDGRLTEVAAAPGFTNHRIGEPEIGGGIRDCGGGPEIVLADADWTRVLAVRLAGGRLERTDLGPYEGRPSFARALRCG